MMLCSSFFFAMGFKLVLDIEEDTYGIDIDNLDDNEKEDWFSAVYLNGYSVSYQTQQLVYFAFTSMSTVGFGDYYPRSNEERIFIAISLMGGLLIFSYIIDQINLMFIFWLEYNEPYEDAENLNKFL